MGRPLSKEVNTSPCRRISRSSAGSGKKTRSHATPGIRLKYRYIV